MVVLPKDGALYVIVSIPQFTVLLKLRVLENHYYICYFETHREFILGGVMPLTIL